MMSSSESPKCVKVLGSREKQPPPEMEDAKLPNGAPDEPCEDESWHKSDWEWPSYDEYYNKQGEAIERRRRRASDDAAKAPFEVIYCVIKSMPWPELVLAEVNSPHLHNILHKLWPTKTRSFKGKELYLKLQRLKELVDPTFVEADPLASESIGQVQLRHLLRFIETEYSTAAEEHERMKKDRCVSFDMLWTFVTPGERVVYRSGFTDEEVCGKVRKTVYRFNSQMPPRMCLAVKLELYDYNCDSFHKDTIWYEVPIYEDERPFKELSIYPFGCTGESAKSLEDRFLAQGATFGYLACSAKFRYMQFKGPMYSDRMNAFGQTRIVKEKADGRVMVDLFSFSKIQCDFFLGTAAPPSSVTRDGIVKTVDISQDPNRMYAAGIVYGFSFRLKKWGSFSVNGFSEVVFDGGSSWNQLVMEPTLKEVTEHLVTEHLRNNAEEGDTSQGIDPIANKGEGCVIMCYGPPGTGKTLTAESLAEKLHAPLWSLSVSELGLNPYELENKLVTILEVANSWNTVLLLDEADVYLEKRTDSTNLKKNAMTGLFLRHLEYYKGVLILTTNRILTFDDAFRSRISVFLRYPKLTAEQRQIIWANLLKRAKLEGAEGVIQDLAQEVASLDLNGREIRNAIQNSQTLARAVKEPLAPKHVINATKVLVSSLATLLEN